ncbi:MAG: cupin domain-containing protein [Flavobacteriaceae bacterium]
MIYTINDSMATQSYQKLQVQKLSDGHPFEVISITLEKGTVFPEHTSPKNAQLILLEGDIEFHIHGIGHPLKRQQYLSFPKDVPHWVKANENSKFLIIR